MSINIEIVAATAEQEKALGAWERKRISFFLGNPMEPVNKREELLELINIFTDKFKIEELGQGATEIESRFIVFKADKIYPLLLYMLARHFFIKVYFSKLEE